MQFTIPGDAIIVENRLLAEMRQLELMLTAGCKQNPVEQITQGKLQERKVNTVARLNEVRAELHEVRTWLKDYRRSLCAPNPEGTKRKVFVVGKRRLKRALEQIISLPGNEEAVEIARKTLEPRVLKDEKS